MRSAYFSFVSPVAFSSSGGMKYGTEIWADGLLYVYSCATKASALPKIIILLECTCLWTSMDTDHLGKSRESQVSSCRGRLRQAGVKIAGKLSPNP